MAMSERWLRRDEDFLRFRPFQPIVAPPLIKDRPTGRWSVLMKLTVLTIVGLLVTSAIYFMQFYTGL